MDNGFSDVYGNYQRESAHEFFPMDWESPNVLGLGNGKNIIMEREQESSWVYDTSHQIKPCSESMAFPLIGEIQRGISLF